MLRDDGAAAHACTLCAPQRVFQPPSLGLVRAAGFGPFSTVSAQLLPPTWLGIVCEHHGQGLQLSVVALQRSARSVRHWRDL